jgi:hypothetical protein
MLKFCTQQITFSFRIANNQSGDRASHEPDVSVGNEIIKNKNNFHKHTGNECPLVGCQMIEESDE